MNREFIFKSPIYFLAAGFGAGLSPIAPGTVGTLVAIPLALIFVPVPLGLYLPLLLLACGAGVYICDQTAKALKTHDHPGIVWDEICGFLITMTAMPLTLASITFGFFLFRFFDILKPFPVSWADKEVQGGLGIMLDDIIAGIYAWAVLRVLVWIL